MSTPVIHFEIVSIPASDTFAKRERKFRSEYTTIPRLLSFEGACASELNRSSLAPKNVYHDDCSGLAASTKKSANALRKLLTNRGWKFVENFGFYSSSNHGQGVAIDDSAAKYFD